MRFKVIFGKWLVYSTPCILLHLKHRNVLFTFPESEEILLLSYCYNKQQNEILNARIKRLFSVYDFIGLSYVTSSDQRFINVFFSFERYNCLANSIHSHETLRLLAFYFPQYAYYLAKSLPSPLSVLYGMDLSPLL